MNFLRTILSKLKTKGISSFFYLILGIVLINLLSDALYMRFDLTKEKRFTLAPSTKNLLKNMDDVAFFTIYLDGELPSNYKRLQQATKDLLNEFKVIAGNNIEFEFEDILEDKELDEKEEILKQFVTKGIEITRPDIKPDETPTEKYIVPGGIAFFKGKEFPINLLKKKFGNSTELDINESIEQLEYELGNIIRKCLAGKDVKLAFLTGHGELGDSEIGDIARELSEFYSVDRLNLNINDSNCTKQVAKALVNAGDKAPQLLISKLIERLNTYRGIIVAKPIDRFKEVEKFMLDQYIMNGGKVIWLVESLNAEMDSVGKYKNIFTSNYDLNLDDLLFRYGVRINPDLVQDIQCHGIPVMSRGGSGKPGFLPWIFYPLVNAADSTHPVVKNLSSVWTQFVSSIDTTAATNIKKTILLHSSQYSRIAGNPVDISLDILGIQPNPAVFNKPFKPVAVLLEGTFKSHYEHLDGMKRDIEIPYKSMVQNNKMIVISDGDMIRNQVKQGSGEVYPLGFDRFASQAFGEAVVFANKKFLLNCIDYLCDESNLIEVRTKVVELRLLNKPLVKEERTYWQMVNMLGPVLAVVLFGVLNGWYRRRKYAGT
ncbi:MAG: gliding motility-associated ABC transporter substrate-binding protein GldG [Flavobacteriales bacterium]|nr:gliding motility-associated ABC transporter substrate-binding protein GldG [Flavobacteriales bacterium]